MTEIIEREPTAEEVAAVAEYVAGEYARNLADAQEARRDAYRLESDPIFFQVQRAEGSYTQQDWLDKIDEINKRYPYPKQPKA